MKDDYDEIEEKLKKESKTKKPRMKVSGKSVFLIAKQAGKPLDPFDKLRIGKTRGKKTPRQNSG